MMSVTFFVEDEFIEKIFIEPSKRVEIKIDGWSEEVKNKIIVWTGEYLNKKQPSTKLPLKLTHLPEYTKNVLLTLQKVYFGEFVTYKQLAEMTNNNSAFRAVGNICNKNPFPLVVPCHRVIASDNSLGGFAMGKELKKQLLFFEGIK